MSDADFGNRAKAPTPGALRASFDQAIADIDRQAALPAGHPEVLRAFEAGRPRLFVPVDRLEDVVELQRIANGERYDAEAESTVWLCIANGERYDAEAESTVWRRCYVCGHRLAYPASACAQCDAVFDDRAEPAIWPEVCTCRRCRQARQEEAP